MIQRFEKKRQPRVITLIHRRETLCFLGIPFSRYLDVEDSEQVLRAIRLTAEDLPIDLILHTPGGLVLAAEQIVQALIRHKAKGDRICATPCDVRRHTASAGRR